MAAALRAAVAQAAHGAVMTTPPSLPSLAGLSWSRHKKPGFSTRVASHASGREVRVALMSYPLYEFEAVYDGLASSATRVRRPRHREPAKPDGLFPAAAGPVRHLPLHRSRRQHGHRRRLRNRRRHDHGVYDDALARRISRTGRLGDGVANVYLNGVRSRGHDGLTTPNMLTFTAAPGAGVIGLGRFFLRFQLPLSRRPDGLRGIHVEPLEARQHEIPQRELAARHEAGIVRAHHLPEQRARKSRRAAADGGQLSRSRSLPG